MTVENFDKELIEKCFKIHKLSPTIFPDYSQSNCPDCKTEIIDMMLERSPNTGSGFVPPKDVFRFYGCPKCCTIKYDKDELSLFAGKKCILKDYIIETYNY